MGGFRSIKTILLISFIWACSLCHLGRVLFGLGQLSLPVAAWITSWSEEGVGDGGAFCFVFQVSLHGY